jgi:hypothetical protein
LTRSKPREKSFLIPSALVYVILKELEKIEDKYNKNPIGVLIRSSKRGDTVLLSNLLYNTHQLEIKDF